jgi:CTP synthase (UTP-ammonia lyase)
LENIISIGIIGDFDPEKPSHTATNDALRHAADYLSMRINTTWIPTPSILTEQGYESLKLFDGLWAAPGDLYRSMDGFLRGIRFAREQNVPFFGT